MRHRKEKRPLGRTSSHRDALLRNLVTSLIDKGRITTTLEKAKELRRVADRMVTLGKRGDLAARRRAAATIRSNDVVKKLFSEVALWSETRPGGYTRILKLGQRPGDNATKALIEFVDRPKAAAPEKPAKKGGAKKTAPKGEKAKAEKPKSEKAAKAKAPSAAKHTPQKRGHGKAPASGS
ncbi:MAG TPA: 50S ribosomal protein L17 [bacterium]